MAHRILWAIAEVVDPDALEERLKSMGLPTGLHPDDVLSIATLLRLADTYEREVERRASMSIAFAAPAIIVTLGVVVGGLVITLFLPILQLSSLVS